MTISVKPYKSESLRKEKTNMLYDVNVSRISTATLTIRVEADSARASAREGGRTGA